MFIADQCCLGVLALFLPWLSVLIYTGCGVEFLISVVLSILGHIPGVIYAFFIVCTPKVVAGGPAPAVQTGAPVAAY